MFVHTVLFTLHKELSTEKQKEFVSEVSKLMTIKPAVLYTLGTPADTERAVISKDYDYKLTAVFDSKNDHDNYQVVQIHDDFRKIVKNYVAKVVIFDAD